MVESKGWDWNNASKERWLMPSEESKFYVQRWKEANCHSILDLGCGLGRHSILFAKMGFKVTATDISREALDYLRKWQKEENVDILCRRADMKKLPFSNDAFDCIFAFHSISHADTEGIKQIFAEIVRVLKPNGKIFLTLCSKEHWAFSEPSFKRIDENTILKTEGAEIDVPHFYANEKEIKELMKDFTLNSIELIEKCNLNQTERRYNKHYFIYATLNKEATTEPDFSDIIGKEVSGTIDRPMGTYHPRYKHIYYPINYGYVDNVFAGDGSEQDIYLLGVNEPVEKYTGRVIAVFHRYNDIEDKWVVAPEGISFSEEEIMKSINFMEQMYDGKLYCN